MSQASHFVATLSGSSEIVIGALGGLLVGFLIGFSLRRGARGAHGGLGVDARAIENTMAQVAASALKTNNELFLTLADERFARANEQAAASLHEREQSVAAMLKPLESTLTKYQENLNEMERARAQAYGALDRQIQSLLAAQESLQRETHQLVAALRSSATRGRWGEIQLRRVVELAGMIPHCDFNEQATIDAGDRRQRPDLIINLPGERAVVVDAKVPLAAFLRVVDAQSDQERRAALADHARALRTHVDELARREYSQSVRGSFDDVIAFIPGDALLAAAFEADPTLQEHSLRQHVLLSTPTTLIAMLRTMAYYWREDAMVANAREIRQLGNDLYQRLGTLGSHFARLGKSLRSSVDAYNDAVGSLDARVFVAARRFEEFGIGHALKGPEPLESIDLAPRLSSAPELYDERDRTDEIG